MKRSSIYTLGIGVATAMLLTAAASNPNERQAGPDSKPAKKIVKTSPDVAKKIKEIDLALEWMRDAEDNLLLPPERRESRNFYSYFTNALRFCSSPELKKLSQKVDQKFQISHEFLEEVRKKGHLTDADGVKWNRGIMMFTKTRDGQKYDQFQKDALQTAAGPDPVVTIFKIKADLGAQRQRLTRTVRNDMAPAG